MSEQICTYNGLTITSHPRKDPDRPGFLISGTISGISVGNGGGQRRLFNSWLGSCLTEDEAHEKFFKIAKKHIDDESLS